MHPAPNAPTVSPLPVADPDTATSLSFRITMPKDGTVKLMDWITSIVIHRDGAFLERVLSSSVVGLSDTDNWYDFTDSGLRPNGTYTYKTLVETALISSSFSSELTMQTARARAPRISNVETVSTTELRVTVTDIPHGDFSPVKVVETRLHSSNGSVILPAPLPKPTDPAAASVTFWVTGLQAGELYEFTADFTTEGVEEGAAGSDSFMSEPSRGRTIPQPPVLALMSASKLSVSIGVSKPACVSAASCSVSGATQVQLTRSPAWPTDSTADKLIFAAGVLEGVFIDTDVLPGQEFTYHAVFLTDVLTDFQSSSPSNSVRVVTPPEAPVVVMGPYPAEIFFISVEIELPAGWDKINGTELYRDDAGLIATIPLTPSSCGPCTWIGVISGCCLRYNDSGLLAGHSYSYSALLTVNNGGLRVTSPESEKKELWTALPAPQPYVATVTNQPSVTVAVSLTPGLESVVMRTLCWENSSSDFTFFVLNEHFFVSSEPGDTGYTVDWGTTYVWKCVFEGQGGTTSELGAVSATLPPKAPVVTMTMVDSNAIDVTLDIENHSASKALADSYRLACDDTNVIRTIYISQDGPSMVTLTGLQPSTPYTCWAKATSSAGESQNSNTASATTDSSPQPTVRTTLVNATAVWIEVTLPVLDSVVTVSGVRISRAMSNAPVGSAWATVTTITSSDTDGTYRLVNAGRAPQTEYWYKAVFLTPADSRESATAMARTGPPMPVLSLNYTKAYEVAVNLVQTDLNTQLITETYLLRNGSRICTVASNNWLSSCLDQDISPGTTYMYTAQYEGLVFYDGRESYENGKVSDPLVVSSSTYDLPKPTLTTTGVNVTAVWIMVEVPELAAEVVVSGVRIFRSPNNVSNWAEVTTLPMINSGATPQTRAFVDGGRNPQTDYYYKAVYLTPEPSKESDSKLARTGPPAPRLSVTEENVKAYSVTINLDNSFPFNPTLITRTFVSRNSTADNVDCGTNKNAAIGSCVDTAAVIQLGKAYVYIAKYQGKVFYGGSEKWENGPESGPLTVTTVSSLPARAPTRSAYISGNYWDVNWGWGGDTTFMFWMKINQGQSKYTGILSFRDIWKYQPFPEEDFYIDMDQEMSLWFCPESSPCDANGNVLAGGGQRYAAGYSSFLWSCTYCDNGTSAFQVYITGTFGFKIGEWTHFAFTHGGGTLNFYRNGQHIGGYGRPGGLPWKTWATSRVWTFWNAGNSIANARVAYFGWYNGRLSGTEIWNAYASNAVATNRARYLDVRMDIFDCLFQCGANAVCDRSGNGRTQSANLPDCPPRYSPSLGVVLGTNSGAQGPRSVAIPALTFGGSVVLEVWMKPLWLPAHGAVLFDFGNYDPLSASTAYNVDSLIISACSAPECAVEAGRFALRVEVYRGSTRVGVADVFAGGYNSTASGFAVGESWQYVMLEFGPADMAGNSSLKAYLNGFLATSTSITSIQNITRTANYIGKPSEPGRPFFHGIVLSELHLWSGNSTDEQVVEHYFNVGPTRSSVHLHLPFNDCVTAGSTTRTALDRSGNGRHAQLSGDAYFACPANVYTTAVNATAVWIMVEVPELVAEVVVSSVRIFRLPNNASDWTEVTTLPMINNGATPQTRTFVDVGRNPQTDYYYKAVYLTPVPSTESDSKLARTGPPAPRISVTEENVRAFSVTISFDNGPPLNTTLITRTFVSRNSTADNVDCGTNKNAAVGSCADTAAAIQPGTAYVYVAQYEGKVFYGGSERWENGPESGPLTVTSDLVTASIPVLSVQQITATTARVCVTYPTDGSEVEILTTEFTRLWLPSLETAPETYSMPRYPAVSVQCRAWTSLEPGTTSNFTAYYTMNAAASLVSSTLQVTQLRPAAPVLSVHPDTDAPTATSVQIRVAFPSLPAAVPSTDPQENLVPKVTRIDLYRDGYLAESKTADLSSTSYVFTDTGLPPGLTFSYWAFLFTAYTQSDNGTVSATTDFAEAPTVVASGIDATSVKVTVTKPLPEQAAAVAIRIYNATVTAGVVGPYTLLTSISKSSPTYEYTHSSLEAGTQYFYKADYTTAGNPNSRAGLDSKISLPDLAWTSPNPPVLSLILSTSLTTGTSTNIIRVVPSTADSDISKLELERVSGGYSCTVTSSWLGGAAGNADCTDNTALPATTYTYVAFYVGQESMKSTNASITVTTPPVAPVSYLSGPTRSAYIWGNYWDVNWGWGGDTTFMFWLKINQGQSKYNGILSFRDIWKYQPIPEEDFYIDMDQEMSLWFCPESDPCDANGNVLAGGGQRFAAGYSSFLWSCTYCDGGTSAFQVYITGTFGFKIGEWTHFAFTHGGGTLNFYRNGQHIGGYGRPGGLPWKTWATSRVWTSWNAGNSIANARVAYFGWYNGRLSGTEIWNAYASNAVATGRDRYLDVRMDIFDCLFQCGANAVCDRSGNGRTQSANLPDCPPRYSPSLDTGVVLGTSNGAQGPRSLTIPALTFGGSVVLEVWMKPLRLPAHGAVLFDFGNYDPLSASTAYNVDSLIISACTTQCTVAAGRFALRVEVFNRTTRVGQADVFTGSTNGITIGGSWQYILLQFGPPNAAGISTLKAHWDGLLVTTTTIKSIKSVARTSNFIGKGNEWGRPFFHGIVLTELHLWSGTRTDGQVMEHYFNVGPTRSSVHLHLPFNDCLTTLSSATRTALDGSGNGRHALVSVGRLGRDDES
eukprot:tig00000269_g23718.t1